MSLLDLPPELFLHITHDVIETCGISGAWKLRIVCRTFADNITHEIMNHPASAFSKYNPRDHSFFEKSAHRYLAARLHNELDVDPKVCQKVRDIAAWAVDRLGTTTSQQQRDDVAFKVCAALKTAIGSTELAHALKCHSTDCWLDWPAWSAKPLDSHDKMVALTAIGFHGNTTDVLTEFSDSPLRSQMPWGRRWLYFTPFLVAFQTDDDVLFNTSLQYLASLACKGAEEKAKLSELTKKFNAHFSISEAVLWSIKYSNLEGLRALLEFARKNLSEVERSEYNAWIRQALIKVNTAKAMQFLSIVLSYKPRGRSMVDKHVIGTACKVGTAAMIKEVLKHANKDINTGTILTLPIFIAVRSGRKAAIDGVIDAGADPKVIADSNMRSVKKLRLTPLELAMHRNSPEVVQALLQRGGGPIPHVSEWTTHQRTYNFLRNKVWEESNIMVPRLKVFKQFTEEERKEFEY